MVINDIGGEFPVTMEPTSLDLLVSELLTTRRGSLVGNRLENVEALPHRKIHNFFINWLALQAVRRHFQMQLHQLAKSTHSAKLYLKPFGLWGAVKPWGEDKGLRT